MTSELQKHIGDLATAQAASDAKIDRVGKAVGELIETFRSSEVRAQQREAADERHVGEMLQAMSKLMDGAPQSSRRASQSSAPGPLQAHTQHCRAEGEHVVLLQYDGPRLAGEMKGAEAVRRSKYVPAAAPTEISALKFHPILTVKFAVFSDTASYVRALQGKVSDKRGAKVEVGHHTLSDEEKRLLRYTRRSSGPCKRARLEQTYNTKSTPRGTSLPTRRPRRRGRS